MIIVEFKQHYVVLMRKGPDWTADDTPELDELQKRHQAHLSAMHEAGMLVLAGPVELHADGDIRGISVFSHDVFRSLDDLKAVVERDPAIQAGRLRAEYLTWFTESSAVIGPRGEVCN